LQHSCDVLLGDDSLGEAVLVLGQRQFRSGIRREKSHPAAEAEETFDRGQRANARNGRQAGLHQRFREALDIGKSYAGEWLFRVIQKSSRITFIAASGVRTGLFFDPKLDDL
jgi:hypothetical protein